MIKTSSVNSGQGAAKEYQLCADCVIYIFRESLDVRSMMFVGTLRTDGSS